ncbi:hypothetical protein SKAU_G00292490 [Synaphobranchus kaupii]|uniref:Cytosolic Fe-S cluster assembly factor NUBP1 n=1 Tax=Synaphobranchus kaupii TaxID=118154 RepID=A0A9Q1IMI1_SYNKA|nr:hypothetical protein SKAU_G00292490 [Synaphobranchus kaupii]
MSAMSVRSDVPSNAPEHCPGTTSDNAGKGSACQGCPNQKICASGAPKIPDPAIQVIKEQMVTVKHKILVLSGKGGVGKSTFSAQLAYGLASDLSNEGVFPVGGVAGSLALSHWQPSMLTPGEPLCHSLMGVVAPVQQAFQLSHSTGERGQRWFNQNSSLSCPLSRSDPWRCGSGLTQVALLDVDICGPSLPRIMGLEGEQVHQSGSGWSPVYVEDNLSMMSIGFLLSSPDDAVIWRGPKKNGMIKQFLRDVDWGELDYLIVDTPPGTSDEHLSIVQYLSAAGIDGAIIITTPQEVSLQDVRKEIRFCQKVKLPIIGIVENMSGFVCPKCKNTSQIFPPTTGGAEKMCADLNLPLLGRVPLDPRIGRSCDEGRSFLSQEPDSPAAMAYERIIQSVKDYCSHRSRTHGNAD